MVVTDGWKAYNQIPQMQRDYDHRYVNHRLWFVDGDDERVHTQGIENQWRQIKRSLNHMTMTQPDLLPTYLFSYQFRRYHGLDKLFFHLLEEIRTQYDV